MRLTCASLTTQTLPRLQPTNHNHNGGEGGGRRNKGLEVIHRHWCESTQATLIGCDRTALIVHVSLSGALLGSQSDFVWKLCGSTQLLRRRNLETLYVESTVQDRRVLAAVVHEYRSGTPAYGVRAPSAASIPSEMDSLHSSAISHPATFPAVLFLGQRGSAR